LFQALGNRPVLGAGEIRVSSFAGGKKQVLQLGTAKLHNDHKRGAQVSAVWTSNACQRSIESTISVTEYTIGASGLNQHSHVA